MGFVIFSGKSTVNDFWSNASPLYFSFVRIPVTVVLLHFALPLGDGILKPSSYLQIPALVLICKSTEQRRLLPPLLPDAPFTLFITVKMLICQMCLTVSKTLKLTPCDVFGNAPVFLLHKRGHNGNKQFALSLLDFFGFCSADRERAVIGKDNIIAFYRKMECVFIMYDLCTRIYP